MSSLALKNGQRFVLIGDSITDCDRGGEHAPYGMGYVTMTRGLIYAQIPDLQVEFFNRGIGGQTTAELAARWEEDVVALQPDWLAVLIGINDSHQYLFNDRAETAPRPYAERYESLLEQVIAASGCSLVLLEPFYMAVPPGADERQRRVLELLPEYIATVHRLAEKFQARLVQLHEIMQQIVEHQGPDLLCAEPVHPNLSGHAVIARALVDSLSIPY